MYQRHKVGTLVVTFGTAGVVLTCLMPMLSSLPALSFLFLHVFHSNMWQKLQEILAHVGIHILYTDLKFSIYIFRSRKYWYSPSSNTSVCRYCVFLYAVCCRDIFWHILHDLFLMVSYNSLVVKAWRMIFETSSEDLMIFADIQTS